MFSGPDSIKARTSCSIDDLDGRAENDDIHSRLRVMPGGMGLVVLRALGTHFSLLLLPTTPPSLYTAGAQ